MTTACEVQAVILVGFGTHLSILTDDHVHLSLLPEEQRLPKTLLPVANTPVLSLILKWLDSAKIDNILIICELNCRAKISEFLKINNTSRIDLVECNSEGVGSADALRLFRDKIRHDFLVISSDLVLTIPPRLLIDPFRSLQSALTAVYFESDGTESKNIRDEDLFDYVGIENSKSRLVYQVSCLDVDEKIELKAGLLKKFPVIDLHTNYKDVHLYLFKRWVIDFIFEKKKISSIKNDLVPLLLKCQYNKRICEREGIDKCIQI